MKCKFAKYACVGSVKLLFPVMNCSYHIDFSLDEHLVMRKNDLLQRNGFRAGNVLNLHWVNKVGTGNLKK